MTFTSVYYFLALIPAVVIFYLLPPKWRSSFLLALSYGFYCSLSVKYSLLMLICTSVAYVAQSLFENASTQQKDGLLTGVAVTFFALILCFFKYSSSLDSWLTLSNVKEPSGFFSSILIPLGLSYYTFRLISFVMDMYWGTIQKKQSFVSLALYVSFFPQILCGPIQRAQDFFNQLENESFLKWNFGLLETGTGFILFGLFEKLVLADRIGIFVSGIDNNLANESGLAILFASYGYVFQLFSDFSGATHIALGVGMLFGIVGPSNFNRPFAAVNIQDFWRRWHMSLTTWLSDYVFMPLQIALRNWGSVGLAMAIMTNMILVGVWHAARLPFLVFGIIHGCFMVGSALTLQKRNSFFKKHPGLARWRPALGRIITFHMVCFALLIFRSESIQSASLMLEKIGQLPLNPAALQSVPFDIGLPALIAAILSLILGVGVNVSIPKGSKKWGLYVALFLLVLLLKVESAAEFIYARF